MTIPSVKFSSVLFCFGYRAHWKHFFNRSIFLLHRLLMTISLQRWNNIRSTSYLHGNCDGAIYVCFMQPALFYHTALLRTQRRRILKQGRNHQWNGQPSNQTFGGHKLGPAPICQLKHKAPTPPPQSYPIKLETGNQGMKGFVPSMQ